MSNSKINLNVHTQARAYHAGFQDAMTMLVDALVEGGDVNFLLDCLEDNINPHTNEATRAKYLEFYDRKNAGRKVA
jgi:hypothetical protein